MISEAAASNMARGHEALQTFIISQCTRCITGDSSYWLLYESALAFHSLSQDSCKALVRTAIESLKDSKQDAKNPLAGLEILIKHAADVLSQDESIHLDVATVLLALTEINDSDISPKAGLLRALIDDASNGKAGRPPAVGIVQGNLEKIGPRSLE